MQLTAEFTVEPFTEGGPGPHVTAAIDAARGHEVELEVGPFGTVVRGDNDEVLSAIADLTHAGIGAGATRISLQVSVT